jgi:hypothetical protein
VAPVVEHQLSKSEALSSNPIVPQKNQMKQTKPMPNR